MGLLDDAIREHLDLKRARGGDPAEIEKMEREALGPVRREPTLGSTRLPAGDEHDPLGPQVGYPDDRDQLLDPGYHDSTAPHPHPHHEDLGHDHLSHGHDDPFDAGVDLHEQPKRRFLRRNRPAPSSESPLHNEDAVVDPRGLLGEDALLAHDDRFEHHDLEHHGVPGAHGPLEHHDPLEPYEPSEHDAPLEHHELSEHHESLAHHDLHQQHETLELGEPQTAPAADEAVAPPPHLQFDHPPKRPRFSAEPPVLPPETEAGSPAAAQPPAPSPAAAVPADPAAETSGVQDPGEVQETTEFDVQKHIAETRFQPDPEPQSPSPAPATEPQSPSPAPATEPPAAEEDVLEETPEFLQDTPEHDRLWFEQRPPRDFDFDG